MNPLTPEQEARARERAAAEYATSPQAIDYDLADCSDAELERAAGYPVRQVRWEALEESERRSLRAANLLAKRQFDAGRRAELEAKAAEQRAANDAALAAYEAEARRAFVGSEDAWKRLWPQLRDQWLVDQTRAALDSQARALEAKRAILGNF